VKREKGNAGDISTLMGVQIPIVHLTWLSITSSQSGQISLSEINQKGLEFKKEKRIYG
jgi:hypothetical protein